MKRQGFTLIELLMVILIIGLLAGITTTVMISAKKTVKASLVNAQFVQISMALDDYKSKYGEYPPDFSDVAAVMRHVRKRWPRYGLSDGDYLIFCNHVYYGSLLSSNGNGSWDFSTVSETINNYPQYNAHYISALVFWLGGLPDANSRPRGFYLNPKAPFGYISTAVPNDTNFKTVASLPDKVQREEPLYNFAENSVSTINKIPAFVINKRPVLYFKATPNKTYVRNDNNAITDMGSYGLPANHTIMKYMDFSGATDPEVQQLGVAVPYVRAATSATFAENNITYKDVHWYEENRFQLLYPGEDGRFSPVWGATDATAIAGMTRPQWLAKRTAAPPCPESGQNLYTEDKDNVVNFATEGSTVESLSAN